MKQERFKKVSHKTYSCTDFLFLEFASISGLSCGLDNILVSFYVQNIDNSATVYCIQGCTTNPFICVLISSSTFVFYGSLGESATKKAV